jgi:hypothetical protein
VSLALALAALLLSLAAAASADPPPEAQRAGQFAHRADHTYLSGQLVRGTGDGTASWRIRYVPPGSPLEAIDPHAGVLALAADERLAGFQDGDWVEITGKILGPASRPAEAAPRYQLADIGRTGEKRPGPPLTPARLGELEALFKALGDEDYQKREDAQQAILKSGLDALPLARQHADDQDSEIADRSRRIVEQLEKAVSPTRVKLAVSLTAEDKVLRPGRAIMLNVAFDNQEDWPVALAFAGGRLAPWQDAAYYEVIGPDGQRVAVRQAAGFPPGAEAIAERFVAAGARREEQVHVQLLTLPPKGVAAPENGPATIGYLVIGSEHARFPLIAPGTYRLTLRLPVRRDPTTVEPELRAEQIEADTGPQAPLFLQKLLPVIDMLRESRRVPLDPGNPPLYQTLETAPLDLQVEAE